MKKILISILCLIMCFLSACSQEDLQKADSTNTTKGSTSTVGSNSAGVSMRVDFESLDFLKTVFQKAKGSEESYNAFRNQVGGKFAELACTNQKIMNSLHEKLSANDFPFPKQNIEAEQAGCTYYPVIDCFYIPYTIDGVIYRFKYFFDKFQKDVLLDGELAIKDYQVGSYAMDLYVNEEWYYGVVNLNNTTLMVKFYSKTPPPDASDLFEFKPLDLSTPTE